MINKNTYVIYWTPLTLQVPKTQFSFVKQNNKLMVCATAKSRAASRLVRTVAGDIRNMLQTWLD